MYNPNDLSAYDPRRVFLDGVAWCQEFTGNPSVEAEKRYPNGEWPKAPAVPPEEIAEVKKKYYIHAFKVLIESYARPMSFESDVLERVETREANNAIQTIRIAFAGAGGQQIDGLAELDKSGFFWATQIFDVYSYLSNAENLLGDGFVEFAGGMLALAAMEIQVATHLYPNRVLGALEHVANMLNGSSPLFPMMEVSLLLAEAIAKKGAE